MIVLVWGTLLGAGNLQPVFVHADTNVIPSVTAVQRYDSNIFFSPAAFLPQGTRLNDYVTTIGTDVKVLHRSRELEASISAGADGNVYAYSTPLNYVTTRVEGTANLDGWVGQWAKGAQLRVHNRFRYTPESPGFLTGTQGAGAGAGAGDPFLRGIQGFRANTYANILSIDGSYPVVRGVALEVKYSNSMRRVGSVLAATNTGATFFDSTINAWSVGPRFDLTPVDSISLSFRQGLMSQHKASGSTGTIHTNVQVLMTDYTRVMPDWRFNFGVGAVLIEPASKAFTMAKMTISTNPERSTIVQLDLSRQVAPSFFLQSGALISNVGQVEITHLLSERLSLSGNVNYAYNESVPQGLAQFENLTVTTGLNYKLTRDMGVNLFYTHTDFSVEQATTNFTILRNVIAFALTAQWN